MRIICFVLGLVFLNDEIAIKGCKNNQQMEKKKNLTKEKNRVLKSSHDHNKIYHQ